MNPTPITILTLSLLTATHTHARSQPPQPPTTPEQTLGLRAQAARGLLSADTAIVITTSPAAFVDAIGTLWAAGHIVPILLDDGTPAAREDIARFTRALGGEQLPQPNPTKPTPTLLTWTRTPAADLPADRAERDSAYQAALGATWQAKDQATLLEAFKNRPNLPPGAPPNAPTGPLGVVVYDPLDPTAPAALALSAFYGQLLLPVAAPVAPATDLWTIPKVDALSNAITGRLDELKLTYAALGDQIDAITLCLNADPRVTTKGEIPGNGPVASKEGEALALTDLLGRPTTRARLPRWAYASQLTGNSPRAVYRAMCSIFLRAQRDNALVIDSYETGGQWAEFDGTRTAEVFKNALPGGVALLDPPRFGLSDWRTLAAGSFASPRSPAIPPSQIGGGVNAPIITVTTMGNWDFFQLRPGNGEPGDIPLLRTPSAVYFVHSWSLQMGDRPDTVGGRWLDKGAYSYVGSVHEPFLAGFVPSPLFAQRMVAGWPIAAAARRGEPPMNAPWRIQVMGDALLTLPTATSAEKIGAPPSALAAAIADGTLAHVRDSVRSALKAKEFGQAVRLMALQGRDADAVRLARALLAEEGGQIEPGLAEALALAAYRQGDLDLFIGLASKARPSVDVPNELADAVWHALGTRLEALTPAQATLLAQNVRLWNLARDALEAGRAIAKAQGAPAGQRIIDDALARTTRPEVVQRLKAARVQIK